MANRRSCCCAGLSKGWWWLLTLLGLPFLYFLMLSAKWDPIEKDIQAKTNKALSATGIEWADVNLEKRGRDVLLSGVALTDAARDQAVKAARAVDGVRIVDNTIEVNSDAVIAATNIDTEVTTTEEAPAEVIETVTSTDSEEVPSEREETTSKDDEEAPKDEAEETTPEVSEKPPSVAEVDPVPTETEAEVDPVPTEAETEVEAPTLTSPQLSISSTDNGVTLSGTLATQDEIDAVYEASVETYGEDNVINYLKRGEQIASPEWLSGVSEAIPSLKTVRRGKLELSDDAKKVSGVVPSDEEKSSLFAKIQGFFSGVEVEDDLTVKAPKIPELLIAYDNEKYILEGVLPSRESIDATFKSLADRVGVDNIDNRLTISDEYATTGGTIILSGTVKSEDAQGTVTRAVENGVKDLDLELTNNLILELKPTGIITSRQSETDKIAAAMMAAASKAKIEKEESVKKETAEEKPTEEKEPSPEAAPEPVKVASSPSPEREACQEKLNDVMSDKTILFRTNKANIKNSSFPLLTTIATVIRECSTQVTNNRIEISGHTDSRGRDAYNLALSQRRANAVKKYLINAGVDISVVTSKGYGETKPVASNDTASGRTKNRRITFSVQ
ncbi:MAG: OmpA family protein [Cocleimonas sp.]|nr:OmpA family protein [Cocleimonas sp.]